MFVDLQAGQRAGLGHGFSLQLLQRQAELLPLVFTLYCTALLCGAAGWAAGRSGARLFPAAAMIVHSFV
jgi:hypothetical protein